MAESKVWVPDTCQCALAVLVSEQGMFPAQRDFSRALGVEVPLYCPAHQGMDYEQAYYVVLEENNRKNKLLIGIAQNVPEVVREVLDNEGNVIDRIIKETVSIPYSFDENRVLVIDWAIGVSEDTKMAIKTYVLSLNDPKITHV